MECIERDEDANEQVECFLDRWLDREDRDFDWLRDEVVDRRDRASCMDGIGVGRGVVEAIESGEGGGDNSSV